MVTVSVEDVRVEFTLWLFMHRDAFTHIHMKMALLQRPHDPALCTLSGLGRGDKCLLSDEDLLGPAFVKAGYVVPKVFDTVAKKVCMYVCMYVCKYLYLYYI